MGSEVALSGVLVIDGLLTVNLDFGPGAFNGDGHWLEIDLLCPGTSTFTTLQPRQPLTPVAYAIFAAEAAKARAFDVPIAIQLASASTLFELINLGIRAAGSFSSVDGPGLLAGSNTGPGLRASSGVGSAIDAESGGEFATISAGNTDGLALIAVNTGTGSTMVALNKSKFATLFVQNFKTTGGGVGPAINALGGGEGATLRVENRPGVFGPSGPAVRAINSTATSPTLVVENLTLEFPQVGLGTAIKAKGGGDRATLDVTNDSSLGQAIFAVNTSTGPAIAASFASPIGTINTVNGSSGRDLRASASGSLNPAALVENQSTGIGLKVSSSTAGSITSEPSISVKNLGGGSAVDARGTSNDRSTIVVANDGAHHAVKATITSEGTATVLALNTLGPAV